MLPEGITLSSDGLLDITEERLNGLLVQDDINEIYDVEQTPFARGKFAAVRRAIHKKSGVHFAAKFLKRRRRAQSSDKEIKHEIAVLILCSDSDQIVQLNAVHESRSDTALLLELATGGELQALLDNEVSLSEDQARICMREVLKALQFLHKRSIAHLDLKPQNILLTGNRVEDGLKLCDFGISRVIENGSKVREILGTPDYVAPEVLQYEPLCLQTDIWSVGVLAYVLLSGYTPFGGDTKQETFLNISQCALSFPDELFKGVSDQAIDFMKSTLRIKPNDRLTAIECLEHFWLKDEFTIDKRFCNVASMASDRRITSDSYGIIVDDDEDDDDENDDVDDDDDDCDDDDGENEDNDSENDHITNLIMNPSTNNKKLNGCKPKSDCFQSTYELPTSTQSPQQPHHQITASVNTNGRITSSLTTRKSCTTNSNNTTNSSSSTINIHNNQKAAANAASIIQQVTATNYDEKAKLIEESNGENKENYLMNSSQLVLHLNGNNSKCTATPTARDNNCSLQLNGLNGYQSETNGYDHHLYQHGHKHQHHQVENLKSPQLVNSNSSMHHQFGQTSSSSANLSAATNGTTNGHCHGQNGQSLFPDAPTTPKVIRKAPSDSPTSVKALVKKFQLESGEPLQTPALLKESTMAGVSDYPELSLTNGCSTSNELKYLNGCNGSSTSNDYQIIEQELQQQQRCSSSTKLLNGSSGGVSSGSSNSTSNITSSPVKTLRATVASVAAAASCSVFCLHKCNGCGTPACRHSGTTTTTSQVVNNCSSNNATKSSTTSICLDHSIIC